MWQTRLRHAHLLHALVLSLVLHGLALLLPALMLPPGLHWRVAAPVHSSVLSMTVRPAPPVPTETSGPVAVAQPEQPQAPAIPAPALALAPQAPSPEPAPAPQDQQAAEGKGNNLATMAGEAPTPFFAPADVDMTVRLISGTDSSLLDGIPNTLRPIRIRLYFDEKGQVVDSHILDADEADRLAAIRFALMLQQSRFQPARRGEQDVPSYRDFEFSIGVPLQVPPPGGGSAHHH